MKFIYDPSSIMKQWPTQGPSDPTAPRVAGAPEEQPTEARCAVAAGSALEIVSDDQLQVESLLRSNERLREEYNALSARHVKLMSLLRYTGSSTGGRESKAFLSLAVSYDTWRSKGAETAIFDLLNVPAQPRGGNAARKVTPTRVGL